VLARALDPQYFVQIRNIPGGPGPEAIDAQIQALSAALESRAAWLRGKSDHLEQAARRLRQAADSL
jgi:argininosuccinate lyase